MSRIGDDLEGLDFDLERLLEYRDEDMCPFCEGDKEIEDPWVPGEGIRVTKCHPCDGLGTFPYSKKDIEAYLKELSNE